MNDTRIWRVKPIRCPLLMFIIVHMRAMRRRFRLMFFAVLCESFYFISHRILFTDARERWTRTGRKTNSRTTIIVSFTIATIMFARFL